MSPASMAAARAAQEATDVERFRLRRLVEGFAAEGELEVVAKPLELVDIGAHLDGNPKAVLFGAAGSDGHMCRAKAAMAGLLVARPAPGARCRGAGGGGGGGRDRVGGGAGGRGGAARQAPPPRRGGARRCRGGPRRLPRRARLG